MWLILEFTKKRKTIMRYNFIQHEIQLVNKGMEVEPKRMEELYRYSLRNYFFHKRYRIFIKNYRKKQQGNI